MKIRIDKCTNPSAWYASLIESTIEVERFEVNQHPSQGLPEDVYWCREGGTYNAINYVRVSDATIVAGSIQWQAWCCPTEKCEGVAPRRIERPFRDRADAEEAAYLDMLDEPSPDKHEYFRWVVRSVVCDD